MWFFTSFPLYKTTQINSKNKTYEKEKKQNRYDLSNEHHILKLNVTVKENLDYNFSSNRPLENPEQNIPGKKKVEQKIGNFFQPLSW